MTWKTEEEVTMNDELRDRFDKIDKHLEKQDDYHTEMVRALSKHELKDSEMHGEIKSHLAEHERSRKWRVALWVAAFGAFVTAVAELLAKYIGRGHP